MTHRRAGLLATAVLLPGALSPLGARAGSDIREFPSCPQCGMDRQAYGHSRMLVSCEDGASVGTCRLACAEKEISGNRDRKARKGSAILRFGQITPSVPATLD